MDTKKLLHRYPLLLVLVAFIVASVAVSCGSNPEIDRQLTKAEEIMEQHPDSAYMLLNSIDKETLSNRKEKARYALLMSQALDKNYIDTTTFDVLQPAIDYYINKDKGSPDEKLKTLYYQGIIFLNRSELDMSMQCFLKANDLNNNYTDTLIYAHLLVAQGNLYNQSYLIDDYIQNNIVASTLYHKLRKENFRQSSLLRALDGCIVTNNKHKADSIMAITDSLAEIVPESQQKLALVKFTYGIRFDSKNVLKSMTDAVSNINILSDEMKLDVALGYLRIQKPIIAQDVFESIDSTGIFGQSLRYLSVRPEILEANGKYKDALAAYKIYFDAIERENSNIYYQKTTVAEERHDLELRNLRKIQHKDKIIWLSVCSLLILLIVVGVIYYFYRIGRMKRVVAENEKTRLQLENDALLRQNEVLELEKHTAELTAENMRLRISQLETENEQLKDLSDKEDLPDDVRKVIKERVEMLNRLFAARILDKDTNVNAYDEWLRQEISDKERFMNSNRLAFKASHPMFIKYLEEHGLTEYEINYLCLYAIGLKGKDVGNYMQLRCHYNISSEIRGKLGIDEHETNIGIYIRKLMKSL